ncbi:hypothetical protein A3Q37_03060 [Streptomyces sp. PTY087I2]|nr:hypothetical protein A3Q37_03060 [Streptomyces sp. PTY087I2]
MRVEASERSVRLWIRRWTVRRLSCICEAIVLSLTPATGKDGRRRSECLRGA